MSAALDKALAVIDKARDECETIAIHLLGAPNERASSRGQLRWREDGKMSLTLAGTHQGKWRNFATDERGDICDLVQQELSMSRPEALDWLRSTFFPGLAEPIDHAERQAKRQKSDEAAQADKAKMMQAGIDLFMTSPEQFLDTVGYRYLQRRHHDLVPEAITHGGALRFSAKCRKFKGQLVPGAIGAMVALMTDPVTGEPTGCHRTYIDNNLNRITRGMLGTKGVVRLFPDETVTNGLSIGEGLESSISGYVLFGGPPIWAGLDAGNLGSFPVLAGVEALTIFSDNDANQTGQGHAEDCFARWEEALREVTLHVPRQGSSDFNNMLQFLMSGEKAA